MSTKQSESGSEMVFVDPRARALAPEQRLRVGDLELAYGTAGDVESSRRAPVLFIMGFGMPGHVWRNYVVQAAEQRGAIFYDQRGAGRTRAPAGAYRMELLASDAVRLLDHLGVEQAHVVGVSMGGMVAQHLALEHRGRVRSLSLLVTHAGGAAARLPTTRTIGLFLRANLSRDGKRRLDAIERMLFPADYLERVDRESLRSAMQLDFREPRPAKYRWSQLAAIWRHDTRRRLGELAGCPTLVVKAPEDTLIKPRESDRLAELIPGARLVALEGAGHGLLRQYPRELGALLAEHMESNDR